MPGHKPVRTRDRLPFAPATVYAHRLEKLKKALRAEIDKGEWAKLYSATSQPFDPPQSGKIAVKVINHFGDEVLKVYPVPATVKAR